MFPPMAIALIHLGLDDKTSALEWVNRALRRTIHLAGISQRRFRFGMDCGRSLASNNLQQRMAFPDIRYPLSASGEGEGGER